MSTSKTIVLIGQKGKLGRATTNLLRQDYNLISLSHKDWPPLPLCEVLVNCAGYVCFGKLTETSEQEYNSLLEANLTFPWQLSKEFISNGGQHIIHIGSTRSISVAPEKAVYSASKHALLALSRSINIDYGPKVRSSIICPGNFTTGPLRVEEVAEAIRFVIEHPDVQELVIGGQI